MEISAQNIVNLSDVKSQKLINTRTTTDQSQESLKKVCNDFEAFFMNQILETSLKNSSIAGEGTGSKVIQGMYTDALSKESAGSLGISEMLFKFLSENKR